MSKQLKLPTLLVVAENPTVRFWVKKHLGEQFFILTAETEQEAMSAFASRLDFIIIDDNMKELNIFELIQNFRKMMPLVPIFLITGKLKKQFREKAHESGVTNFLSDQLYLDELESRIQEGLKIALSREKTVDVSSTLKKIPKATSTSLTQKIVINDQGLKMLAEAKSENVPVSLLLLRIDEFENWENKEEIFQLLGQFIQKYLREKDILTPSTEGRYLLLLYNTFPESAKKVAERLKTKINYHPFSAMRKLTVSIAVSTADPKETGLQKMIDSAAKSLKTKKETNFILSFEEEENL